MAYTTTQNSSKLSVIIENKRNLRMNGYRKQHKENISETKAMEIMSLEKDNLDCSAHKKCFVKPLRAVENLLDENLGEDEESINWETVNETDTSSDSVSSELSDDQEENSSSGIHSKCNDQHEDVSHAYADSHMNEHNDISNIDAKRMEFRTKISRVAPMQNKVPVPEHSFDFVRNLKLPRNCVILDMRIPDTENGDDDNFPLDSRLNHSDELLNSCLPKINEQTLISDVNNDDIAYQVQSENDNHTKIIQHESLSEIANTTNTGGIVMEKVATHRDIGIMVNMSLESNDDENKVLTNEDDQKSNAIADVQNPEIGFVIDFIADLLEKGLERQKICFENTLDCILERGINKYLEKCKEPEVDNIEGEETNRKIMRKPVKKCKARKIVRKRFCPKKAPAKKPPLVKRFRLIKNANNQIYESVEQMAIKATFEEGGKSQQSDHITSKCRDNNLSDLFSNTNLSNICNNFLATSTPFESNCTNLKNNNSRITAIYVPHVLQRNLCTKQATLIKTHNMQQTTQVMDKDSENLDGSESMDDLYITMDFTQSLTDDMDNNIVHLEKDDESLNSSDPCKTIPYDELRDLDPNLSIRLEPSQVSAIQLSCKEALKKNV